jgi:hypothetical protein
MNKGMYRFIARVIPAPWSPVVEGGVISLDCKKVETTTRIARIGMTNPAIAIP